MFPSWYLILNASPRLVRSSYPSVLGNEPCFLPAGNGSSRTVVLEGPPVEPETPTPRTGTLDATVSCQVCRAVIVLDSKSTHHVAKCTECGEATVNTSIFAGKEILNVLIQRLDNKAIM